MTLRQHSDLPPAEPDNPADFPQADGKQAAVSGVNTYSIRVTGRVQGVNFRHFVKRTADSLLVRGWVRNEPDGSVVAVLQSPETRLIELLMEQLREVPPPADVAQVNVEQLADAEHYDTFEILR